MIQNRNIILLIVIIISNTIVAQVPFKKHILDQNTWGAGGFFCTDIESDGNMDILAAGLQSNQIICLRTMAPIQFPGRKDYPEIVLSVSTGPQLLTSIKLLKLINGLIIRQE